MAVTVVLLTCGDALIEMRCVIVVVVDLTASMTRAGWESVEVTVVVMPVVALCVSVEVDTDSDVDTDVLVAVNVRV